MAARADSSASGSPGGGSGSPQVCRRSGAQPGAPTPELVLRDSRRRRRDWWWLGSVGGEEAVAEGVHWPDGGVGGGSDAVLPAPSGDVVQHGWVVGDDADRDVAAGVDAGDDGGGLVVTEHDQDEVLVVVVLH